MTVQPFDTNGIHRDEHGVAQYDDLPGSLVAMLRATVERWPEQEAIAEPGGEHLSYRQLWERASRVAGGLRDNGVRPGDRVANLLPAGVDWVLGFLGTVLAGAVTVPVNTRFADPEIEYVLTDSAAAFALRPGAPLPEGTPYADDDVECDDLVAIFYTSGTTGHPKGAMTTHRNVLSTVQNVGRLLGVPDGAGPGERVLLSIPLFHVTACTSQLVPQLAIGGSTTVLPRFQVQDFLRTIVSERITSLTNTPAIYYLAFRQENFDEFDLGGINRVHYGGAPVAPALVEQIAKRFPNARLANGFGLTETCAVSTWLPHAWAVEHAESVGFAAPAVDLTLDSPDAEGVGELLIRGPNVVAGYWNKPDATAAAFAEGWLRTGDLARIDEHGLVLIADRIKDMINRGGENVYCVEVENALAGAPGVGESAVVGVPDSMMGEKVGAVVVPLPGAAFDEASVLGHLRERLADFKVPQYFAVRSEPLPRNAGGKILKNRLRDEPFTRAGKV
ncbi:MAG TPA: AMP-binding protein [Amycolatopsis sp.]|nr:AMP-binding protein [Amycolatopsis sp.]